MDCADIPEWSTELTTSPKSTIPTRANDWGAKTWSNVEADPERAHFPDTSSAEDQAINPSQHKGRAPIRPRVHRLGQRGALAVLAQVEEEAKAEKAAQAAKDKDQEDLHAQLAKARVKFEAERHLSFGREG